MSVSHALAFGILTRALFQRLKIEYTLAERIARDSWHVKTVRGSVSRVIQFLRRDVFLYPFLACPQFA